jgi:putative ABC transport system substrate-binding protein
VIAATGGVASAQAAAKATTKIPIVFVIGFDPVRLGLVASLGRPDKNVTGASVYTTELAAKRLGLLVALVPGLRNVGILANPGSLLTDFDIQETTAAAGQMGLRAIVLKASNEVEIDAAFPTALQQQAGAIFVNADTLFTARRDQIVALAARNRIPTMYPWREYVESGGLVSYGAELAWAYRQIGSYAGLILKGAQPRELPVVLPTKFDLVINLKTAAALGLDVPTNVLVLADQTIE